ncbi:ribonuclease VapC28 [Flexivirga endophytica]|uniref:Ribonuclease VapC n=1 Tax=Flexivirga endophytica TaxID=1849103 RepID=A0A916T5S5_9MICO|nr:type II toxin-antitoxin system VapC family toxin [Flexivirga endophytica]GGB32789.1 ribonuclease VapC28 [Flexivirga endophytica]GHB40783.1 ribonuclease VapC28 [Flexivirga endophytica]
MIVDTSALVAILWDEPEATSMALALQRQHSRICTATLLETSLVLHHDREDELTELLGSAGTEIIPFDRAHLRLARMAHQTFGRGSGSAAKLNFGDCFSYALAKAYDEPLLFKGDDFTHTDIRPALS